MKIDGVKVMVVFLKSLLYLIDQGESKSSQGIVISIDLFRELDRIIGSVEW